MPPPWGDAGGPGGRCLTQTTSLDSPGQGGWGAPSLCQATSARCVPQFPLFFEGGNSVSLPAKCFETRLPRHLSPRQPGSGQWGPPGLRAGRGTSPIYVTPQTLFKDPTKCILFIYSCCFFFWGGGTCPARLVLCNKHFGETCPAAVCLVGSGGVGKWGVGKWGGPQPPAPALRPGTARCCSDRHVSPRAAPATGGG